ncbi:MAG: hypothetical protein ACE5HB_01085 [Terriglobia bacterium]
MGAVFSKFRIANPLNPSREDILELLVDTGALYNVLPTKVLRTLGIEPFERKLFKTADGRKIQREVGEALFAYAGESALSKVIFGRNDETARVGRVLLLALGVEVNARTGRLQPLDVLPLYLASNSHSCHPERSEGSDVRVPPEAGTGFSPYIRSAPNHGFGR